MAALRTSTLMIITQVLSISFFLLHQSPLPAITVPTLNIEAPSSLVNRVCKMTTICSYKDCIAALALDPRASSTSNPKALAKIALKLVVSNSTNSKKYIEAMAKKQCFSLSLKSALEYCVSQYESVVIPSFKMALKEVDEDPLTANYDAKVASDGANYCEEKLSCEGCHDVASITTRNYYVKIYSDIGFAVTNMISPVDH
ncbi:cell wall / vacuolar inhibitor of fructosidase 2-like [Mangifera indica]|uniref:cell wall / vacuolar inhibitor of fructosidase 2-like n=1 Tax=Mangifera indica TaxID=29780 RepID=UPI001CFBA881|nr:cell wall / vacuolar inhibitor of fructosidase 2-like [Mangifera indica]